MHEIEISRGLPMTENPNDFSSPGQPCLTRFELAALLNVSVRTVDRMIAAEQLPVRRVRGHVRFLRSDVDRYLHGGKAEIPKAESGNPDSNFNNN